MKTLLHIFKRMLTEKYPKVEFDFHLSQFKNDHMGLNCNVLSLSEHVDIISDI